MYKSLLAGFFLAITPATVSASIAPTSEPPPDGSPVQAIVTCYAPGAGGSIEGPFATSKPNREGQAIPRTLDDVRLGKSQYVTLASNESNYGKWYSMGDVTYVSVMDNKEYTLRNVVGYVHDTGGAFSASGCKRWNTCSIMYNKFDVAYGDFRGGQSDKILYKSKYCSNKNQTWKQVGGIVGNTPTTVENGPAQGPQTPALPTSNEPAPPTQQTQQQPLPPAAQPFPMQPPPMQPPALNAVPQQTQPSGSPIPIQQQPQIPVSQTTISSLQPLPTTLLSGGILSNALSTSPINLNTFSVYSTPTGAGSISISPSSTPIERLVQGIHTVMSSTTPVAALRNIVLGSTTLPTPQQTFTSRDLSETQAVAVRDTQRMFDSGMWQSLADMFTSLARLLGAL